jgi:Ca2+-dependent lipid-binding protein
MQSGNLIIRPLEANLTHSTELLGKMSPYVKVILGNDSKCTPVVKRGGRTPTWDSELLLRYHGEATLRVEVWDKERIGRDDLIGFGTYDLSNLLN